jgi:hypothetical protein
MNEWSTVEYAGLAIGLGIFALLLWVGWSRLKKQLQNAKTPLEKFVRLAVAVISNAGLALMFGGGGLYVGSMASSNEGAGDMGWRVALWGLWLGLGAMALAFLYAAARPLIAADVGGKKPGSKKKKGVRRRKM